MTKKPMSGPHASATEPVLTVGEVADQERFSKKFIYRAIKSGDLECLRFGRSIRITVSACARWRAQHRT
jgi:excisionase family DNA binding protein